jgi:2-(1,2-epoxy-1,2-dihydrophenyl)acetyl-CoA isomerase
VDQDIMWASMCADTPRRSLTHESADALLAVVEQARVRRPKVLVFTGDEKTFCVGGDVVAFGSSPDSRAYIDELATRLHALVRGLQTLDSIVVMAVDGVAAGAGMPLVAAGDIVLASTRARFTLGYTKLGLSPDGGTTLLTHTLGLHRTLYAALVNPVMDAATAQQHGLVAEVLEPDQLLPRTTELAESLAAGSRSSLAATKRVIRQQAQPLAQEALDREQAALVAAAGGADAAEGIRAFVEKRTASFG